MQDRHGRGQLIAHDFARRVCEFFELRAERVQLMACRLYKREMCEVKRMRVGLASCAARSVDRTCENWEVGRVLEGSDSERSALRLPFPTAGC